MLRLAVIPVIALTLLSTGCDSRSRRVPIAGTVLIDGKPLAGGTIAVVPSNDRPAISMIDQQGRFQLTTYDDFDGAILGEHPVEIFSRVDVGGDRQRWLIPPKYASIKTSGLVLQVDKPNPNVVFELTWGNQEPAIEVIEGGGDVGAVPGATEEALPVPGSP
ncbi:hypothetical protein ETAA8_15470 [Anatilimnocola aggregata]|uniref:Carboxypeptidase regulatory-like domain-containing protein n=1 Tax=Anatilimnocola aggregata TaxID=2528021 RepID=A0A517Y890_9BACT|nr:DUF4198 domain-containing protein [Anatilimnocola aggregata]QDU26469.1 hypothetical protein ETAA8_15470 [Anatilimnocola aggregata]